MIHRTHARRACGDGNNKSTSWAGKGQGTIAAGRMRHATAQLGAQGGGSVEEIQPLFAFSSQRIRSADKFFIPATGFAKRTVLNASAALQWECPCVQPATQSTVLTHLIVSTPGGPAMRHIMLMRYMWSAMLSGPGTPRLTQPVRLVVWRSKLSNRVSRGREGDNTGGASGALRVNQRQQRKAHQTLRTLRFCSSIRKSMAAFGEGCCPEVDGASPPAVDMAAAACRKMPGEGDGDSPVGVKSLEGLAKRRWTIDGAPRLLGCWVNGGGGSHVGSAATEKAVMPQRATTQGLQLRTKQLFWAMALRVSGGVTGGGRGMAFSVVTVVMRERARVIHAVRRPGS